MDLLAFMKNRLCRELRPEEVCCLKRLTPQGVTKINADMAKGIPVEETMRTLLRVFEVLTQRRENVLRWVPEAVLQLRTAEPLTTDQLAFLAECHHCDTLHFLLDRQGNLAESVDLENCVLAHLMDPAVAEKPVSYALGVRKCQKGSRLIATDCPDDVSELLRPIFFVFDTQGLASIRISPTVTWFNEWQDEIIQVAEASEEKPTKVRRDTIATTCEPLKRLSSIDSTGSVGPDLEIPIQGVADEHKMPECQGVKTAKSAKRVHFREEPTETTC